MAEEVVTILKVGTEEAVKSVNDLKENIKTLKSNLGELAIGSEEYQETLDELKINQNALKDAMYATSSSMEDVAAAAVGASKSYNSLVHQMAALKEEWRATNDEARRDELGKQIAEINQQLKTMDASVGNFQRNVGNYESGVSGLVEKFDKWGGVLKQMPPTLGATKESIGKVGESMQLIGKQPILGIIGLLAPIIIKITDSLKDNETAMDAVKKVMAALQPVFDVFSGILEKVAQGLSKVADWVIQLVGQGVFDGFISKVAGVGNAILQYLLAPIKSAIAGFKGIAAIVKDVFTGDFKDIKKHAKEAGEGIADAWKEGFSFKANFQEGEKAGATFVTGLRSEAAKKQAKEAGEEIGKAVAEGVDEGLKLYDVDKALKAGESKVDAEIAARLQAEKEITALVEEEWLETEEFVEGVLDEMAQMRENDLKDAEMKAKARVATVNSVASATADIMNVLADMYENDEKNSEKNAKKIKALRIASATIEMLQGAVGAFAQASATLPPPYGQIVGAASAASVIAMGIANINKIKSQQVGGSASAPVTPSAAPAVVSAPDIDTGLQSVRNVTSASEEERLNRMANEQRVYILQSDIEAAGNQSKVQVAESSF